MILVGAQAVFLHAGEVDEAIATETKDADLAVHPELLAATPRIEEAMRAAGFDLDARHPQPGTWISSDGMPVDLLIPDAVSGRTGRGRSGRIKPHSNMSTRRVRGIEGALVDHAPMTTTALDADDHREHRLQVAGPMALLVAKLHKVSDREAEGARQRPRSLRPRGAPPLPRARGTDSRTDGAGTAGDENAVHGRDRIDPPRNDDGPAMCAGPSVLRVVRAQLAGRTCLASCSPRMPAGL